MIVVSGNNIGDSSIRDVVLTIGVFDGVHTGHRNILEKLKQISQEMSVPSVVITLNPDPDKVLSPEKSFTVLTPVSRKIAYLEEIGLDYCFILTVDKKILTYSAEDFFSEFIYRKFTPRALVIGEDFRFGRNREGDIALIESYARKHNFQLHILPLLNMFGRKVSSSEIRRLLVEGDVNKAQFLLGRLPEITGKVVRGEGRGRQLGFPTANLLPDFEFQLAKGVYIGEAVIKEEKKPALLYVGTSPSFGGKFLKFEIYIPNYSGFLYGQNISFLIRQKLREERFFRDKYEIQQQLSTDRENLIRYLSFQTRI